MRYLITLLFCFLLPASAGDVILFRSINNGSVVTYSVDIEKVDKCSLEDAFRALSSKENIELIRNSVGVKATIQSIDVRVFSDGCFVVVKTSEKKEGEDRPSRIVFLLPSMVEIKGVKETNIKKGGDSRNRRLRTPTPSEKRVK